MVLLLILQTAAACQYKINVTETSEVQSLYERGTGIYLANSTANALEIRNISVMDRYGSFELYNRFDVPISIALTFDFSYSPFAGPRARNTTQINLTIPANGSRAVQIGPEEIIWARFAFDYDSIRYAFLENNATYVEYGTIETAHEECRTCFSKVCLDDGAKCSFDGECGGGYCIRNRCNYEPKCFGLECECGDEAQCTDDGGCAKPGILDIGQKPKCTPLECKTHYASFTTGQCAKSPEMLEAEAKARIEAENMRGFIMNLMLLAPIILTVFFFLIPEYLRGRAEAELERKYGKK